MKLIGKIDEQEPWRLPFKWLTLVALREAPEGKCHKSEREIEKGQSGTRRGNSFPLPPPPTIALSSPSKEQMPRFPRGISRENVRGEINLRANLCEKGGLSFNSC